MKYKAVLYDIDGTILNTLDMNMYPLMQIIKEELGVDYTYEDVLQFASQPGMKTMEQLNIVDPKKTYARWVQYVNEYPLGATPFEGIEEVFKSLEGTLIQAVVSAKTREQYQIDMVDQGLGKYMQETVLADDTDKHKPDPEPILLCLKKLKLQPDEILYIGDSLLDYQAAKSAHVDFAYAKWGSLSDEGINEPTYCLEKPLDILTVVK